MFQRVLAIVPIAAAIACDSSAPSNPAPAAPAANASSSGSPSASGVEAPAAPPAASAAKPTSQARGLMLALAQFVTGPDGKPIPGPARLEFLFEQGGSWQDRALEDEDGRVFHKAMVIDAGGKPEILTLAGGAEKAPGFLKLWTRQGDGLTAEVLWKANFGGRWSRMRDAEVADLFGSGEQDIAVATHDQGVVAVVRGGSREVVELDRKPSTFVHEIEVGDVDGDGAPEVYATPSEPNRLDGTMQKGEVVRYLPKTKERSVVADLGERHAKEILVSDIDGDGRQELYVSVEGHMEGNKLTEGVEVRRYEADTKPTAGQVIARLDDRLMRFLTAGDLDGDGKRELVASSFSRGVWMYRPGSDPNGNWQGQLIDSDSGGFEHATILSDLDGDGRAELYVASDNHKEVRRYVWKDGHPVRTVIYRRPDARPIFTWNLMPVPLDLIPAASAQK
jgi:hypothetical protein